MDQILAAGIICIIAAIIGGRLRAFGIEIPLLESRARQVALALFGLILLIISGPVRELFQHTLSNGAQVATSPGASATPSPAATYCTGTLAAVTITGNLDVPEGAQCKLAQTTVTGNVTVEGGLIAEAATIGGSVIANHADYLAMGGVSKTQGSAVSRNITVNRTSGLPPHGYAGGTANFLCNSVIGGNVEIHQSSSAAVWSIGSLPDCTFPVNIAGNLNFDNNDAAGFISNNTIGGNLDCHSNHPAATGNPNSNIVSGQKKGECSGL